MFNKISIMIVVLGMIAGCSTFDPKVVDDDFGNSVRNMVENQKYDPVASENPPVDPPMGVDVDYARDVLDVYRTNTSKPKDVKGVININVGG